RRARSSVSGNRSSRMGAVDFPVAIDVGNDRSALCDVDIFPAHDEKQGRKQDSADDYCAALVISLSRGRRPQADTSDVHGLHMIDREVQLPRAPKAPFGFYFAHVPNRRSALWNSDKVADLDVFRYLKTHGIVDLVGRGTKRFR